MAVATFGERNGKAGRQGLHRVKGGKWEGVVTMAGEGHKGWLEVLRSRYCYYLD